MNRYKLDNGNCCIPLIKVNFQPYWKLPFLQSPSAITASRLQTISAKNIQFPFNLLSQIKGASQACLDISI